MEFLEAKFGDVLQYIIGEGDREEPKLCNFYNIDKAISMLNKHLERKSRIAVHGDVDMDGIGSAYIIKQLIMLYANKNNVVYLINSQRVHGVNEKHIGFVSSSEIDLFIILDSSTNEIEIIKQMECDVLVIDHHEVGHNELSGNTKNGEYVIVNNMVANEVEYVNGDLKIEAYEVEKDMSCGLVVYELLRVYDKVYKLGIYEYTPLLYQWACVTLLTDVIRLANKRNQYYVHKTFNNKDIESCLHILVKALSRGRDERLNKSFIAFKLAPYINATIRAGHSGEALDIVLNNPDRVLELSKYKELQDGIIETAMSNNQYIAVGDGYAIMNITDMGISQAYTGVIAARVKDKYHRSSAVCIQNKDDGMIEGSARGLIDGLDYREFFENSIQDKDGIEFSRGHANAFGFKLRQEILVDVMQRIKYLEAQGDESNSEDSMWITFGDIGDNKGKYHIYSMAEFKRNMNLLNLAILNSYVSTEEQIEIVTVNKNLEVKWKSVKYGECEIEGLTCKLFKELETEFVGIYVEYTENGGIQAYIREYNK